MVNETFHKGSTVKPVLRGHLGKDKSGCLRLVTPDTGAFALYFGSRDPEKVAT